MRGIIIRTMALIREKETMIPLMFFCSLFVALFLGDGKQGIIEIYSSSIAFACWGMFFLSGFVYRKLPKFLFFPITGMVVVALISSAWSDSIGFSVSWFVRFACGYIVYRIFYSLASKRLVKTYAIGVFVLVCVATGLSFISFIFPWFRTLLPPMNLIDVRHGHSHLADLLIYALPLFIFLDSLFFGISKKVKFALLIGYLFTLFFTFARGAWVVLINYYLYVVTFIVKTNKLNYFKHALYTHFLVGAVVVVGIYVVTRALPDVAIRKQATRLITASSRIEYWRQAVETVRERPFFGSGPGTFSLESQRLQSSSGRSSWFAHSIVAQCFAETGLMGAFAFSWLIVSHLIFWMKKRVFLENDLARPLLHGTILLFLYSTFEFVLDYQVMWFLFMGGAGLITGVVNNRERVEKNNIFSSLPTTSLVFIATFYFFWVLSSVVSLTIKRYDIAYLIAPFDAGNALVAINTVDIGNKKNIFYIEEASKLFHKKNSAVLFAMGELFEKLGQWEKAENYYKQASYLSPNTSTYYIEYFLYLSRKKHSHILGEEIIQLSLKALPSKHHAKIYALFPYTDIIGEYYKNWMARENSTYTHGYAGLFYRLGIADLRNVEPTEKLLILARDIYPDLAHLHIELAAYYYHIVKNKNLYTKTLTECIKIVSAARQCEDQFGFKPYYPGEYKDVIW